MEEYIFLFKSSGQYIGFLYNDFIYTRDGNFLGWLDSDIKVVWGKSGSYKGKLVNIDGHYYILRNLLEMPPIPQTPKRTPVPPPLPFQQENIPPITLPPFFIDGFGYIYY